MAYEMLQNILDQDERVYTLIMMKNRLNSGSCFFFYLIEMSFNIQMHIYFFQHSHKFFTSELYFFFTFVHIHIFFSTISSRGIQINVTCSLLYGTVKGKWNIYNDAMFMKKCLISLILLFISGKDISYGQRLHHHSLSAKYCEPWYSKKSTQKRQ